MCVCGEDLGFTKCVVSSVNVSCPCVYGCRTAGVHVTTTFTSSNNLGLVITGLTEADVGTYTCTAMYSNSEYLVRSVVVDSFCKYIGDRVVPP